MQTVKIQFRLNFAYRISRENALYIKKLTSTKKTTTQNYKWTHPNDKDGKSSSQKGLNFYLAASKKPSIKDEVELKVNTLYPKALDGFLLVLSKDGDIIYISETVAKYLGLQQVKTIKYHIYLVLQIRKGNRDNYGIISHISP